MDARPLGHLSPRTISLPATRILLWRSFCVCAALLELPSCGSVSQRPCVAPAFLCKWQHRAMVWASSFKIHWALHGKLPPTWTEQQNTKELEKRLGFEFVGCFRGLLVSEALDRASLVQGSSPWIDQQKTSRDSKACGEPSLVFLSWQGPGFPMALVCSCERGPSVSGSRGVLWCRCSCCWLSAAHVEVQVLAQAAGLPGVRASSFGAALMSAPWLLELLSCRPHAPSSWQLRAVPCCSARKAAAVHTSSFGGALMSAPWLLELLGCRPHASCSWPLQAVPCGSVRRRSSGPHILLWLSFDVCSLLLELLG